MTRFCDKLFRYVFIGYTISAHFVLRRVDIQSYVSWSRELVTSVLRQTIILAIWILFNVGLNLIAVIGLFVITIHACMWKVLRIYNDITIPSQYIHKIDIHIHLFAVNYLSYMNIKHDVGKYRDWKAVSELLHTVGTLCLPDYIYKSCFAIILLG